MHIIQCYNLDRIEKSKNGWPKAQSPASSRPIPEYSMCSGDAHAVGKIDVRSGKKNESTSLENDNIVRDRAPGPFLRMLGAKPT